MTPSSNTATMILESPVQRRHASFTPTSAPSTAFATVPSLIRCHCCGSIGSLKGMSAAGAFVTAVGALCSVGSLTVWSMSELNCTRLTCSDPAAFSAMISGEMSVSNLTVNQRSRPSSLATFRFFGVPSSVGVIVTCRSFPNMSSEAMLPSCNASAASPDSLIRMVPGWFSPSVSPAILAESVSRLAGSPVRSSCVQAVAIDAMATRRSEIFLIIG